MNPVDQGPQSPYDFITNPSKPPKKSLLPGGNSFKARLLIVGIGITILLVVAIIVINILGSSSTGLKNDYLSLAQQQAELIRVSTIGIQKANDSDAKNLAILVQGSLSSEQPAILNLAKKAGVNTSAKSLALGQNTQTDKTLDAAAQTNQFDTVFIKTMQDGLKKYQQTLKKIYDATSDQKTKSTLSEDYINADLLINRQNN